MSRIIDGNANNFLRQFGYDLPGIFQVFTSACFVKLTAIDGTLFGLSSGGGSNQQRIMTNFEGTLQLSVSPGNYYGGTLALNTWALLVHRRRASGAGYVHELIKDGVVLATSAVQGEGSAGSELRASSADLRIGSSSAGAASSNAKFAHAFTFLRALSDAELLSVSSGANPDTLNPLGRREYYPMTDSGLVNLWAEAQPENPPALTVVGTVAVDVADNPTVDVIAAPSSVTLDDSAFEPGKAITGSYANYASAPTVVTLTDSAGNTLTPAVTINDTAKTFSTVYPARITTGTGATLLRGAVTLELT